MPRAYKENDENKIIDCTLAFLFVENEKEKTIFRLLLPRILLKNRVKILK